MMASEYEDAIRVDTFTPPNNSVEPTRLAAKNGHLSCPPGWRRVMEGSPATAGGSPRGR